MYMYTYIYGHCMLKLALVLKILVTSKMYKCVRMKYTLITVYNYYAINFPRSKNKEEEKNK